MKIGALARRTGTPVETIRYYEREGLLPAAQRSEANYRLYTEAHAQRLSFIRHCRGLDMAQDEIRTLLALQDAPQSSCRAINELLDAHIGHVAARMRELQQLKQQLQALRARCQDEQEVQRCGILHGLSAGATAPAAKPHKAHVHGTHKGYGAQSDPGTP